MLILCHRPTTIEFCIKIFLASLVYWLLTNKVSFSSCSACLWPLVMFCTTFDNAFIAFTKLQHDCNSFTVIHLAEICHRGKDFYWLLHYLIICKPRSAAKLTNMSWFNEHTVRNNKPIAENDWNCSSKWLHHSTKILEDRPSLAWRHNRQVELLSLRSSSSSHPSQTRTTMLGLGIEGWHENDE